MRNVLPLCTNVEKLKHAHVVLAKLRKTIHPRFDHAASVVLAHRRMIDLIYLIIPNC